MNNKEIKKRILSIITVSIFLIVMTSCVYLPKQEELLSSFAFLQAQNNLYIKDVSEGILLHDATPTKDEKGLLNQPYTFQVVNNSNQDVTYKIVFENNEQKAKDKDREVLPNKYLRYSLNEVNTDTLVNTLPDNGVILTAVIPKHSTTTYDFRMWLDYDSDNGAMNKIFVGNIQIYQVNK